MTIIRLARGGRSLEYALLLRNEVFVRELGMFEESDRDDRDEDAIHLIAYVDDEPVGAVRLNEEGPGEWTGSRLQVLPDFRSRGVGRLLIGAAEAVAYARGCKRFTALVRQDRAGLFEGLRWTDEGEGPEVAGVPHRMMRAGPPPEHLLLTVGYQGRSPEGFVSELLEAGVETLVDVRHRASSRSRGFAKSALRDALAEAGIGYAHVPAVGCPPDIRKAYQASGDFKAFANSYLESLASSPGAFDELVALASESTACLMCMEARPSECHRSLLAQELSKRIADLAVVHL